MMLQTKYECYRLSGSRQDVFMFPYIYLYNTCAPLHGTIFLPQGQTLNKLCRGPLADVTQQILSLKASGFRKEYFFMFGLH